MEGRMASLSLRDMFQSFKYQQIHLRSCENESPDTVGLDSFEFVASSWRMLIPLVLI